MYFEDPHNQSFGLLPPQKVEKFDSIGQPLAQSITGWNLRTSFGEGRSKLPPVERRCIYKYNFEKPQNVLREPGLVQLNKLFYGKGRILSSGCVIKFQC